MSDTFDHWEEGIDAMAADYCREEDDKAYHANIEQKKVRYLDNKSSPVHATITCANCNTRIIKTNYQTQFCSNKGNGNCKDQYWNSANDKRANRARMFNRYR